MDKPLTSSRVSRVLLLLQEFNITIVDKLRKSSVVVDYLPRLYNPREAIPVDDYFPHERIFVVSIKSPCFIDIANYLVTRKLPPHLSGREKWNIIQKRVAYSQIQGDLFYRRAYIIIRRCVREEEVFDILKSAHDEPYWGHFVDKWIEYKVL